MARISGTTESDGRIIVVDETSGEVEYSAAVTAENEYEANDLSDGNKKIVLFRANNGETTGYSEVETVDTIYRTNIFASGSNSSYSLGDDTDQNRSSLTVVGLSTSKETWVDIDPGNNFVVALRSDGTLWTWGDNFYGQLGQGDTEIRPTPTQIGTDTNWVKTATGRDHTVALKSDGTLWSWGRNDRGQLGLGDWTNKSTLTKIGTATNWTKISSGYAHTMAIKSNGQLWAWGQNDYGQLAIYNTTDMSAPIQVGALTTWSEVYTGRLHTIAKRNDGTVWGCGHNGFGQFGTNQVPLTSSTPVQIGSGYTEIAVGYDHTLIIKSDGTLWGCGHNGFGQCGNGTVASTLTFTKVGTANNWSKIVCTAYSSFALKTNGTLWSFGLNNTGQLALGYAAAGDTGESVPTQVGVATDWVKLMLPAQGHNVYVQNGGIEI